MNNKGRKRHHIALDIPQVSLLWPEGKRDVVKSTASVIWEADLGLSDLVNALSLSSRYLTFVRQVLTALTTDVAVIEWRQAVLNDFVRNPSLVVAAQNLLPQLANLQSNNAMLGRRQRNLLIDTADHLSRLESFTQIVKLLHAALHESRLESPALRLLHEKMSDLTANPDFQTLQDELPELRAPLERVRSVTIGINLDLELRPISAVLLTINDHKVSAATSWLERVMGLGAPETTDAGIAPLHFTPESPNERILSPLFQDMDQLLTRIAQPIAKSLSRYSRTGSGALSNLEYELAFFTAAAALIQRLQAGGVTFCQPVSMPIDVRSMRIQGLVNIALAIANKTSPVSSDVSFGDEGRIAVLTGPNSGGKTTYLRSVGLAQVMFQSGLFIPAASAKLSPVDSILTHFPALESRTEGRLAEEAIRLRDIFQRVTPYSLVLLNETFSSTSAGEAVYLAFDILCGLRGVGTRAVFATHLIELVNQLSDIESAVESDSHLMSLVAGVELSEDGYIIPTYVVAPGQPLGQSYAREIARRHGISLMQLLPPRP
ncbi:MAG: hypothetical protein R3E39_20060 [Anaerolineae bacterium]